MKIVFRVCAVTALMGLSGFVTGQTGAGGSDGTIEKCPREMGTLAIAEPQSQMIAELTRRQLGSPTMMLRMIAQESGCFAVVERGIAMQNMQQERALAAGGMLQQGSNVGGGQMQAADFVMTAAVQFADDTGGVGAGVGSLFGRMGGVLGAIGGLAGGVRFKEAETTMLVSDVRSGIQVASAEGKASKMNFSLGGWGWGGFGWASAGGYSKTPEGKLVAASLLDNYNKIVQQIKARPSLIRSSSAASQANAAASIQATSLVPTSVPATPAPTVVGALPAGLVGTFSGIYAGEDQGAFTAIIASNGLVSGTGRSSRFNQDFVISGIVTATGEMKMSGSGRSGAATFTGQIDQTTGQVMGQWEMPTVVMGLTTGKMTGNYNGQRQ